MFPHQDPFLIYEIYIECEGNQQLMTETILKIEEDNDLLTKFQK